METILLIAYIAMVMRLLFVGSERIFLRNLKDYDSIPVSSLFFIIASITLLPILIFVPVNSYQELVNNLYIALISSIAYTIGFYSYVKALSEADASLIAPLYNSSLLWLLFLGALFLGEDVSELRITGCLIMFFGLFFLYQGNVKLKLLAIRQSKASLLMIFGSLFIALGRTIDTYAIRSIDERLYAWLINFLIGLYLLVFTIIKGKTQILKSLLRDKPKTVIFAGFTNGWGYLMLLIAIAGLQVTVAEPLSLLSVFVTAFLAKRFLSENVDERLPGMILMFLGAVLLVI